MATTNPSTSASPAMETLGSEEQEMFAQMITTVLGGLQSQIEKMSETILKRIDDMNDRVNEMEVYMNTLIETAGIDKQRMKAAMDKQRDNAPSQ